MIETVPLSKIDPNPARDFTLNPHDEAQVEKLEHSMIRHGFFGSVVGRRSPDGKRVQIALGHTRVEAANRRGLKAIQIDVRDISDDEMIRLMCSENAIQAGSRASAVMNEVSAVINRLALAVLSDDLSQIRERWPEIAQCFQSQKAYDTARGTLESGDGIGEPLIRAYLGNGEPNASPRSKHQIGDALSALKQAGLYGKAIIAVRDQIAADAAEETRQAEIAEREAEQATAKAKTKGERDSAAKAASAAKKKKAQASSRKQADERASRTAKNTAERQPRIFDETCIPIFANEEQTRAFRESVTKTAAARQFIALEQQLPLAKRLVKEMRDRDDYRGRITATTIGMYVSNVIQDAIRAQHQIDDQEREVLMQQQKQEMFAGLLKNVVWSLDSMTVGAANKLLRFLSDNPEFADHPKLSDLIPKLETGIATLNGLMEKVDGKEFKASKPAKPLVIEKKSSGG